MAELEVNHIIGNIYGKMKKIRADKLGIYTLIPFGLGFLANFLLHDTENIALLLAPLAFFSISFVMGLVVLYLRFYKKEQVNIISLFGAGLGILPIVIIIVFLILIQWVS